jgi:hypothetical protein
LCENSATTRLAEKATLSVALWRIFIFGEGDSNPFFVVKNDQLRVFSLAHGLARLTFTQRTIEGPLPIKTRVFKSDKPIRVEIQAVGALLVARRMETGFTQREVAGKAGTCLARMATASTRPVTAMAMVTATAAARPRTATAATSGTARTSNAISSSRSWTSTSWAHRGF